MDNTSEMAVFVRVVEAGNFSAAARELRLTPSAVSKLIGRLEDRLDARLLNRTTRRVSLTEEGRAFYQRSDIAPHNATLGMAGRPLMRRHGNATRFP